MSRLFYHPVGHCLGLLVIGCLLFLPNLGGPSLWDIDESHNAECAREMMEAECYVVPTFNFRLRTDKPVLQYWCLMASYRAFGVNEFAARFVSTLCGLGTMLLTYWLGQRMFGAATGFLAAVVLASSIMFCVSAHAVTPDALLILFTTASFLLFWQGYQASSGWWLVGFGVTTALAVLAKGPVGLVLPFATNLLFLVWERRLRVLLDWRMIAGCVLFGMIALPWYILVGSQTKFEFWEGFFWKHNLQRFQTSFEGHKGPFFYHPLVLIAAFAPWSCFLGLTVWYGSGKRARQDVPRPRLDVPPSSSSDLHEQRTTDHGPRTPSAYRLLWCWIAVWFVFFSAASTKLPNYVLPCYPALAILTARFLIRWQSGTLPAPRWLLFICLGCYALVGVILGGGLLIAAGTLSFIPLHGRELPELAPWAVLGLLPVLAAGAAGYLLWKGCRLHVLSVVVLAAVALVSLGAAVPPALVDQHKVNRPFAAAIRELQIEREARIGCFRFYQPGLVFYTQRRIEVFPKAQDAVDHLHSPLQSFLVLPADQWCEVLSRVDCPTQIVARKRDFQTGKEILLVTNRDAAVGAKGSTPSQFSPTASR
jgi:4-amino-4-deoxy-L-arabinose transferase-like glycosyltransferase